MHWYSTVGIVKNQYTLSLFKGLFDKMANVQIFYGIELMAGYKQVFIESWDEPEKVFHTSYIFWVLCHEPWYDNTPSNFEALMNETLKNSLKSAWRFKKTTSTVKNVYI